MTGRRTDAIVLCAFIGIVAVMTYPQIFHLADGARDWGDPLLNAWIMWWEVDAVASGNFAGFFDANIFFPHVRTLAYSEFLIPQSLVAAPLLLVVNNPLLAYNVVLLLSFVATAFAMYLLGRYLTGSAFSGFVGGLALAFSPFMFSHLSHIQVIGAAGIPLAFLFLHRYFDEPSLGRLLCFSAAYVGQALANTHFALYLTYAAGAYILYRAVSDRRWATPSFYGHMATHAVVSLAFLVPFFGQYLRLKDEMAFTREMVYSASWFSFFAAPPINRIYGTITEPLRTSEASLFPGFLVILLASVGIWASRGPRRAAGEAPLVALWGYRFAGGLAVAAWLIIIAMSVSGGIDVSLAGVRVRANDFQNPLIGLIVATIARMLLRRFVPALGGSRPWLGEPQRFYGWLLFLSVLLSFGASSPYRLLYQYVPGFDGVRSVARIYIVAAFCLATFTAYGARLVAERLARRQVAWAAGLLPLVMLVEFFSAPVPLHEVAWGEAAPAAYAWLARQEGDHAVIEYPLEVRREFDRMLYSAVHRKKLVNGMSGFQAPVYEEMRLRMRGFPSRSTLEDIRDLGVRWIIVHPEHYGRNWPRVSARIEEHERELALVAELPDALIYETRGTPWLSRDDIRGTAIPSVDTWVPLPKGDWTVSASIRDDLAGMAIDGSLESRWNSSEQKPGDRFVVDFGSEVTFGNIVMWLYTHPHDYPRGYRVEVSDDGQTWRTVAEVPRVHVPITKFIAPLVQPFEITFAETTARHLRIVQTGTDRVYVWSIHELDVRRREGSRRDA